jgi:hypothetical protein
VAEASFSSDLDFVVLKFDFNLITPDVPEVDACIIILTTQSYCPFYNSTRLDSFGDSPKCSVDPDDSKNLRI